MRSWQIWVLVTTLAQLGVAGAQAVSGGWRIVGSEQGVLISTRTESGDSHPTFRGQATIKGSVLHVLAIVLDTARSTKWVRGADGIEIIRDVDDRTQHLQMFTDLPWPIRDRDMVMKRSVEVLAPGTEFRIRYQCAPGLRGEQRRALRVTTCDSHFTLKGVDADKTYVDYQVHLDPGGGLPSWGIRYLEKRVTVDTIYKLERQVRRTPGQYAAVIRKWAQER
jgi:START domain